MLYRTKHLVTLVVCFSFGLLTTGVINSVHAEKINAQQQSQTSTGTISGKVSATKDASGYTYIEVDTGDRKVWAAGPVTPVSVGDSIAFTTEMPMQNFESKSMQRSFDVIYFVNSFITDKDSQTSKAATRETPGAQIKQQQADKTISGIDKAEGGNTIAEIHTNKSKLNGKTIRVRGQVTKYNAGIMGKNWIHIRDGSGPDDLTITTENSAAMDEVVTVEGELKLDKDFGSGYVYPLIVEDATITKK